MMMPDCMTRTERRARREHRCCECRGRIHVGEGYVYVSGVWEREPYSFKFHAGCWAFREELDDADRDDGGEGVPFECLGEEAEARGDEVAERWRAILADAAREAA